MMIMLGSAAVNETEVSDVKASWRFRDRPGMAPERLLAMKVCMANGNSHWVREVDAVRVLRQLGFGDQQAEDAWTELKSEVGAHG